MKSSHRFQTLLLAATCFLPHVSATLQLFVGTTPYPTQAATFGSPLSDEDVRGGILMMPPTEDRFLCEYPESLESANVEYPESVALLVELGGCTVQQKAEVALALNRRFSSQIRFVILSNNDVRDLDGMLSLQLADGETETNKFNDLTFLSISTRTAAAIQVSVESEMAMSGSSPFLSASGGTGWNLLVDLRFQEESDFSQSSSSSLLKLIFLYVVGLSMVVLLLVYPCFRLVLMWREGGGAISIRRNARGRIAGLHYTRPDPGWFVLNSAMQLHQQQELRRQMQREEERQAQVLSKEQVLALPEITFQHPLAHDERGAGEPAAASTDPGIISKMALQDEGDYTTSCTTCSICIEDFQAGETLRILPRCGHAYHLECVLPWLTERHKNCPLCKVEVLETVEHEKEVDGDWTELDTTQEGLEQLEGDQSSRGQVLPQSRPETTQHDMPPV